MPCSRPERQIGELHHKKPYSGHFLYERFPSLAARVGGMEFSLSCLSDDVSGFGVLELQLMLCG
jgi:hypothetical protein